MALLWGDTFESGTALSANYTNIITASVSASAALVGTWGVWTTGTNAQKYYGEFTKASLSPSTQADGRLYGTAEADFDHAYAESPGQSNGYSAFQVFRNNTNVLGLYHGEDGTYVGSSHNRGLSLYGSSSERLGGVTTQIITPGTVQRLRMSWRMSSGSGIPDGYAQVYVDGVLVINAENVVIGVGTAWNKVMFGPMGRLDSLVIADTPSSSSSFSRELLMALSKAVQSSRLLGRNGVDPPQELPDDLGTAALNVDFSAGGMGTKRPGAATVTINNFSVAGLIGSLHRYLPSDDETAAELWATDSGALTTAQRLAGGTTWAAVTLADAIQAPDYDTCMVSFNGKLVTAYNSAVNRTHVYPAPAGTHRRHGLAKMTAPTAASGGAGAVTDVRQYATCNVIQSGGVTVVRGNLSAKSSSVTLTANTCTVTRASVSGDGETHWETYVYSDDDNFSIGRLLTTTAIGTATSTDNNSDLSTFVTAPPLDGANTPFPSVKYLLVDGTHLIGAGGWETSAGTGFTPSPRLVCWTPALGTSDTDGDDERIVNTTDTKNFLYVDSGVTGIGGPLYGAPIVFAYRQIYKLVPTAQATSAYSRLTLRTDIGCIRHHTIVMAEDESGQPALYWLSHRGPYRMSSAGIEFIGRDVQDRWDLVILGATGVWGWGMFLPEKGQIHWYVASGSSQNDPNERLVYDVRLGRMVEFNKLRTMHYGWAQHTGVVTEARCGCLFSNTLGSSMSRDLKPYIGRVGTGISAPTLWKADNSTTDASTTYQAYVKTKAYNLSVGQSMRMLEDAYLVAKASSGVTLTLTVDRDFGAETRVFTASIAASGAETRVYPKVEGTAIAEAGYLQFQCGDSAAVDNTWTLDSLVTPLQTEGPK